MIGLERITNFIKNLDTKEIYPSTSIILGVITLIISFIFYRYYSNVKTLQQKLKYVNRQREEARSILEKNKYVLQQQARVDQIWNKIKILKLKNISCQFHPAGLSASQKMQR